MKAAIIREYGSPDVFRIEDVPAPKCGPRDVLIDVHASSVNPVDTKIRRGFMRAVIRYRLPWVLGLDVSGVVREVGASVTRFRPGDEVYSSPTHRRFGCYAEQVAIDEAAVAKKPANLSHEEAAGVPLVALTAWGALNGRVKNGSSILVQAGAGGVGVFAIQLAKHMGAVVAATCSTKNVELVRSLGADRVIDYTKEAYDRLLEGYDGVVDTLGGDERKRARSILKRGGFIACITGGIPEYVARFGPTAGVLAAVFDNAAFTIGSFFAKAVRVSNVLRSSDGAALEKITLLIEKGAVRPVVDRVVPLEEIGEAHRYSETGRARGKIVIKVR